MLLRLRWFIIGAASSLGAVTYLVTVLRRARERLTPQNLAKAGATGVAGLLESAADRIAPGE